MLINLIKSRFPVLFAKFCAIGVLNTCIGYSIIFFSLKILGLNYLLSNTLGYIVGLSISFSLNKYSNFKSKGAASSELPKFLLCFIVAFACNNLILIVCVEILYLPQVLSILVAGIIYTGIFYLLSRDVVFIKTKNSNISCKEKY